MIMISLISIFAYIYISKGVSTYQEINKKQFVENYTFSLVVKDDSLLENLDDIDGYDVDAALSIDQDNILSFLDAFNRENTVEINLIEGQDYLTMAKNLIENNSQVILLNEAFRPLIEENFENFSDKTRVLKPTVLKKEASLNMEPEHVDPNKGFNILISGIDTYGEISTISRSDVNIILSVNPSTKKILITSIPRDTYTRISGGGNNEYDKLTHSGIYGVNSTVESIENLFDADISYYAKVNFSSVGRLIDSLGGINVNNPVAFKSSNMYFEKGNIHLSGERALRYSRERYKFKEGDLYRGQNQIRVMEGIIRKMMSPSILLNYGKVLDIVQDSSETNIPFEKITELVNGQIEYGGDWEFESIQLNGEGTRELPSYAMPGWVQYVYVPDKDSIREINSKINEVIE